MLRTHGHSAEWPETCLPVQICKLFGSMIVFQVDVTVFQSRKLEVGGKCFHLNLVGNATGGENKMNKIDCVRS